MFCERPSLPVCTTMQTGHFCLLDVETLRASPPRLHNSGLLPSLSPHPPPQKCHITECHEHPPTTTTTTTIPITSMSNKTSQEVSLHVKIPAQIGMPHKGGKELKWPHSHGRQPPVLASSPVTCYLGPPTLCSRAR